MIIADTSVWLDHWRRTNSRLAGLLTQGQIVVHPFVLGEIALGSVTPRAEVLARLARLPRPRLAHDGEVLDLIERAPLWGRGIGWVDAHLLASALLDRLRLWTLHLPLARVARELGVALPVNP